MLESLRRLWRKGPKPADLAPLQQWADARGHSLRRARDAEGCVIDGKQGTLEWRIEWGASTRSYVEGFELRLIAEIGLPKDLMVLVLNRELMETMEKIVFEQFVEGVQTRIDTETPPEMRWLVMFPKLSSNELGRLRDRYAAVGSIKPWLQQWLSGPLDDALAATIDAVPAAQPVVLTIARGRLVLRTPMADPDTVALVRWFSVFEHALREARRVGRDWADAAGGGQSTQPSAWSHSQLVRGDEDEVRPG